MKRIKRKQRDYIDDNYKPFHAVENNLVIIKSVKGLLERNNIKKYTFYKPLKQCIW